MIAAEQLPMAIFLRGLLRRLAVCLVLSLLSCSTLSLGLGEQDVVLVPTPSATPRVPFTRTPTTASTATFTPGPTDTATPPPSATPGLLALAGTPLPAALLPITLETAGQVSGLAEWYEPAVADLAWTPDGHNLVVATVDLIHFYDVSSRQVLRAIYPNLKGIVKIAFSPSGTWLVAGSRRGSETEGYISGLELWLGPNWQPKGVLYGTERPLSSMAFSPDEQYLAVAYCGPPWQQSSIDFWSPLTWIILDQMDTGAALNVAVSPDGALLAVSPDRYTLRIYDRTEKNLLYKLPTSFTGAVNTLAFSPDGFTLASGHYDGMVRLWDMRDGSLLLEFPSGAVVQSLVFSPDGRMVATGASYQDSLVRLWSAGSGTLLRALEGHTGGVTSLVFSPDGQYLTSASYDGTIRLWGMRP